MSFRLGGNPVACAAALATIDELQDGIVDNARERGQWLESELTVGVGYYKNVLRFQPPLSVLRDQLEYAVDELRTALETVA